MQKIIPTLNRHHDRQENFKVIFAKSRRCALVTVLNTFRKTCTDVNGDQNVKQQKKIDLVIRQTKSRNHEMKIDKNI